MLINIITVLKIFIIFIYCMYQNRGKKETAKDHLLMRARLSLGLLFLLMSTQDIHDTNRL